MMQMSDSLIIIGIKAPLYAVLAGASIIEKHFTLDNKFSNFRTMHSR